MKNISRFIVTIVMLGLAMGLAACAPKTSVSASDSNNPSQPAAEAQLPTNTPAQIMEGNAKDQVQCDQIIPPDEADLLLNRLPAKLDDQSSPGTTICTWHYTSASSGQESLFQVQVGYGSSAVDDWNAARKTELSAQPTDLVANSIDGLGDENYVWISKPDSQQVVYVRRGTQTLILRYYAADILFLGTESGMIDSADRIFTRLNP